MRATVDCAFSRSGGDFFRNRSVAPPEAEIPASGWRTSCTIDEAIASRFISLLSCSRRNSAFERARRVYRRGIFPGRAMRTMLAGRNEEKGPAGKPGAEPPGGGQTREARSGEGA